MPVRVTNMAGVDLETYRFDYDLTFTALLMNADGTIYHTYGGRTWEDAQSHLSERAFADVLTRTLAEHAAYEDRILHLIRDATNGGHGELSFSV